MSHFYLGIVAVFIFCRAKLLSEKGARNITIAPVRLSSSHYLEILVGAQVTGSGGICNVICDINNHLNLSDVTLSIGPFQAVKKSIYNKFYKTLFWLLRFEVVAIKKLSAYKLRETDKPDFSAHVNSTLRRLFFGGEIREDEWHDYENLLLDDCKSIFYSCVDTVSETDAVFFSHGIYSLWGPVLEAARLSNTKLIINGSLPYYGAGFYLARNAFQVSLPIDIGNRTNQQSIAISLLERRLNLETIDQKTFNVTKSDPKKLDEIKHFYSNFRRTISIFPNCLWDGNIDERDTIFDGLVDCINYTIKNAPLGIGICIRLHPAEATLWKSFDGLKNHIVSSENVLIVNSDSDVISHDIANLSDISIVYDGIMAIELSFTGNLVLVPSKSPYTNCPGIIVPSNKDSFWDAIEHQNKNVENIDSSRYAVSQWVSETYLTTLLDFPGYVSDGAPINGRILLIMFSMPSFLKFYKTLVQL